MFKAVELLQESQLGIDKYFGFIVVEMNYSLAEISVKPDSNIEVDIGR